MRRNNASALPFGLLVVIAIFLMSNERVQNLAERFSGNGPAEVVSAVEKIGDDIKLPSGVTLPGELAFPPAFGSEAPGGTVEPEVTDAKADDPDVVITEDFDFDPLGAGRGFPTVEGEDARAAAAAVIDQVRVAGRGPKTGYARDQFGKGWIDDNDAGLFSRNGCDTRNDILRRDLLDIEVRPKTKDCVIVAGRLAPEPYTGKEMPFLKAEAHKIHIDHIVPLSYAWQMGAARWDKDKRVSFANDALNLVASDGPQNSSKGDSSPASWLPPNKRLRCTYGLRFSQIALRYDLAVTKADKEMMVKQCSP